jgi:adenosylcobyric acid synthase
MRAQPLFIEGTASAPRGARTAILQFPAIAHASDVRLLTWAHWLSRPAAGRYDVVILPGSTHTIGDLRWMREAGLDAWVRDQHRRGALVVGLCGGFQMLGRTVCDPRAVESHAAIARGLGLLPVDTIVAANAALAVREAITARGTTFTASGIRAGETRNEPGVEPFAYLADGCPDGARAGRVIGTSLHGALTADVCEELYGIPIPVQRPAHD